MANTVIQLKKSSTPASSPTDLANGELAINFADGKLFYKNTAGYIAEISGGGYSFGTVNANGTLVVADVSGDVVSIATGNNITIVGDAVNDKVTIGLSNDVTLPGVLYVKAIGGDEGGQIELANAVTNSTLTGNVVVDIYQNKLRFYEKDSPNKGAFIDLSIAASGVGSNLLATSGGTTDTVARATAEAAFDRANTSNSVAIANVNYVNTAMQAAFAQANNGPVGANNYLLATIAGANTAVGTGANAFTSATISGANTAVGTGANTYAASVGVGSNTYLLTVIAGANTAVGTGANTYLLATLAGANTAVGTGANTYAAAIGTAANSYMISVQNGSNTAVGTGANAFTSATIAGANTAVGTGANTVGSAAFAAANSANSVAIANVNYVNTAMQAAFSKANSATDIAVAAYANANSKFSSSGGTITGDVNIVGNLTISGNTVFIDATSLQIDDPLIYLAGNNYTSDIVDIGFIGNYVNATGSNVHTGLYREHTNKMYYLFQGYDQEPVNNHIGAMSNNMTLAVLNADMITNNLTLASVNSTVWITAAYNQANNGPVGANNYLLATIAGANTAVGTGANSYATAAAAGANAYMISVQNGSNTAVGTGANTYLLATLAGANTAVGTGANTYLLATIAGANTAVGTGANSYAAAIGTAANSYMISVQNGSNTAVGTGANTYLLATLAGANTAVGAGANTVGSAAFAKANNALPLAGGTLTGRVIQSASGFGVATDEDISTRIDSGFWQTTTANIAKGWPETTSSWYHLLTSTHYNDTNYFSMQIAADFFSQKLWYRSTNNSGSTTWGRIVHTGDTAINQQLNSLGVGTAASGTAGEIRATNNITAYYSDKRLKDIKSTIQNALDKVMSLSGIIYTNNETAKKYGYDNTDEQVGVVAQEVEAILPQIVKLAPFDTEYDNGVERSISGENYKTVQYDKLIPLLIEAMKEQQSQIEVLRAEINTLKGIN